MSLDYCSELWRATSVHRVLPLQQHLSYFSVTSDVFLVILLKKIIGPLIILGSYAVGVLPDMGSMYLLITEVAGI
jgi:hypothetical protein